MKIDGNSGHLHTSDTGRVDGNLTAGARRPEVADGTAGADRVQVSPDAKLASAAIDAVRTASDIRPDAVERAKALLASGTLGADAEGIADALIDRALES